MLFIGDDLKALQNERGVKMAKKQWGTTYDEDILKEFQVTCEEYGMKANVVLEALMKFFTEGNCRIVVEKGGLNIEVKEKNR